MLIRVSVVISGAGFFGGGGAVGGVGGVGGGPVTQSIASVSV